MACSGPRDRCRAWLGDEAPGGRARAIRACEAWSLGIGAIMGALDRARLGASSEGIGKC